MNLTVFMFLYAIVIAGKKKGLENEKITTDLIMEAAIATTFF